MPLNDHDLQAALSPVSDGGERTPEPGIALCLSGGGYRAMIFHLGVLWRLNELGYLSRLDRVSSVSGGSITAAMLGLKWSRLGFANGVAQGLVDEVIKPLRAFAHETIDVGSVLKGIFLPGSISDKVANAYRKHLFGEATLQDLPDDPPRFVINATNVQTGVLWRFSKPYMRDYLVGEVKNPTVSLATAVAASSAFPPVLSPARLELDPAAFSPPGGEPYHAAALHDRGLSVRRRGLRQPRPGDRLEALRHDPRQRCRLGDERRPRPGHRLGHACQACARHDRQPGPRAAQAAARCRLPQRRAQGCLLERALAARRLRHAECAALPGGTHCRAGTGAPRAWPTCRTTSRSV